jgi:hypothetical protein
MFVCPYGKPGGLVHSLVRFAIERSAIARKVSITLDDVFYGKNPPGGKIPPWLSA